MTKILLVEDDKSLREIYGTRLLAENFDIVSAGDGEEALALAIKEKPDLIISDVMMPKISGFDMLDILRSTTETRDIKVIMMTALSSEDQRIRGEQLGADKYLVKSQVGIEDVVQAVHQVLGDGGVTVPSAPATSPAPAADAPATPAPTTNFAAPDATAPATDAPAETTLNLDSNVTPESTTVSPEPVSGSAPGNDAAGPLPPQPSELNSAGTSTPVSESTLPQPTAPFSSPRPTNLGENVVHPEAPADTSSVTPVVLSTPVADPSVATPVMPLSDTTVTPDSTVVPASTDSGLNFEATTPDLGTLPTIEPTVSPVATPETPVVPDLSAPTEEKKDETTPPSVSPTTPAV